MAHDRGSSHGQTRVIRQAYFEHPDYVPLARASLAAWAELEYDIGRRLFFQTGLLQSGPSDGTVIRGLCEAARLHNLPLEEMNAAEAMDRFPQFRLPEQDTVLLEHAAGYLLVEVCVRCHLKSATQAGAEWRQEKVLRWQADENQVTVVSKNATYHAKHLIITAGPWAANLLPAICDFRILAKHLHWFRCSNSLLQQSSGCPAYLFEIPGDGIYYGFPTINGDFKVAEHSSGTHVVDDVALFPRDIDETDLARVTRFLKNYLPSVEADHVRNDVCFYTMSPDEHFIIGQHPQHSNVTIGAGLSGHGFKFTPVLGQALADLACDGKTDVSIGFLTPERLRR